MRVIIRILPMVLAMLLFAPTMLVASEIGVTINGAEVSFEDQSPIIIENRVLVPVADVFRQMGFSVYWDGDLRQTALVSEDHHIVIAIGSDLFFANGAIYTLDVPAQIINGRNMLPIRRVLEAVGKDVDWDDGAQAVVISYDAQQWKSIEVPIWYYYAQYRNPNPRPATSNGHFAATYENFIDTMARPNTTGGFARFWGGYNWEAVDWPPVDPLLNQGARQALQQGFAGDDARHTFPFSPAFFDSHISQLEFHFWIAGDADAATGLRQRHQIGVGLHEDAWWSDSTHAHIVMHEIGHSLGLGEHLTTLFDEVLAGYVPTPEQASRHDWSLLHTTAMDRVLMELAGPVEFWEAVFWEGGRYNVLWDEHLGDFISFGAMQFARRGHQVALRYEHMGQDLMEFMGLEDINHLGYISVAFANAFNAELSAQERERYGWIAHQGIQGIADWAWMQGLQPYRSHNGAMSVRTMVVPID